MNWYYAEGNQQKGPVSEAEFQQLVASGKINDATMVWREGMASWQPCGQVHSSVSPAPSGGNPPSVPAGAAAPSDAGRINALKRVNGPAIGLMVTGGLGFLATVWSIVNLIITKGVLQIPPETPGLDPQTLKMIESYYVPASVISILLGAILNGLIIFCGIKLRALQSFGLVMAGTIFAMIPCSCPVCCVGIPIGIWVLVVMKSADVKPYFD